jgi:hypothetical protein
VSGRDVGASVRQRLLLPRAGASISGTLQYFAMERFLACRVRSHRFVLKGALLLTAGLSAAHHGHRSRRKDE